MVDYYNNYSSDVLMTYDGHKHLEHGCIKYGDALAGICYMLDIPYEKITERWPKVSKNEMWIGGNILEQLEFLIANRVRDPGHILEIGAGRGEVTLLLTKLGYKVTTIDPGRDFKDLLKYTKNKLFPNQDIEPYKIINNTLQDAMLDYNEFDTILMVESLEHILAEHFDPEWQNITQNFSGYFIVVNWRSYHPIAVGQYAPPDIHCRLTDDKLYDNMSYNHKVLVRAGSHLCLDMKTPSEEGGVS